MIDHYILWFLSGVVLFLFIKLMTIDTHIHLLEHPPETEYEKRQREFAVFVTTKVWPEYLKYKYTNGHYPTTLYFPMGLLVEAHRAISSWNQNCVVYDEDGMPKPPQSMNEFMNMKLEWNGDEEGDLWWVGMEGETCPTMIPS